MISCPSLPSIAPLSNPFHDLSSKELEKIALVAVGVLVGIGIVLAMIAVAGVFGALPWIPLVILGITLSLLFIAGIAFGTCKNTSPQPVTPLVLDAFDPFVENLFAGGWQGARASSETNPLLLFESQETLQPLEYGRTDTDNRWISLILKQQGDTHHYILIETSIPNTWAGRSSDADSFTILQDRDTQFLLRSIHNHYEVALG